jgi:uncharacterized protein (TIGR02300 family)
MSNKAAVKLERGTKRTCQNPECSSRFYDLNRDPITCPICNTVYAIVVQPQPQPPARSFARPAKKAVPFVPATEKPEVPTEEGAELVALEGEEDTAPADGDETFIEEVEEESTDMSGIVDAPAEDDQKQ